MPQKKTVFQQTWFFLIIILFFSGFYLFNLSGWLIHDDEGTDLYEVWQLSLDKVPGVDFVAEQQPLFLLFGKSLISLSDDSVRAVGYLRLASVTQVLAGAFFLGFIVKRLWDVPTAALALGTTLTSGLVYEQARLFRPDPMMFGWELIGLGFVLLAVNSGKRPYWAAAGFAYGVAVLMKLFGLFPVVGLALFFVYLFISQPGEWQQHLQNGLAFSLPFLLVSGGGSLFLYGQLGFYYQEVFNQHLSLGQQKTIWDQLYITSYTYLLFIIVNAVAIFILPLAFLNRRSGEAVIHQPIKALLYAQLLVPLFFIAITRPLHARYFIFLLPSISLLLGLHFKGFLSKIEKEQPKFANIMGLVILIPILFSIFASYPTIPNRLVRKERDTVALAQFIANNTQLTDLVVSDYASLNFHAKRPSIYEASIIAGGRIGGGIITGSLLIERIEEMDVKMVLVHVEGGDPPPHQLNHLKDFDQFQQFLETTFVKIRTFDRAGQLIEIYARD